jgi:Tol biopolymer transport system component
VRANVDSAGLQADDDSAAASLAADGQVVAFMSSATNLVPGDTNGWTDVFVHDMATGITERVSVDSGGAEGNWVSFTYFDALSDDGQVVVFESLASNLVAGDANGKRDVFVHDRTTGETQRVSVDSSGVEGNGPSSNAVVSGDGRIVAYGSDASNLVAGDTNFSTDLFVFDRATALTERVSVASSGVEGNSSSDYPSISADGRFVGFESISSNLVAGDKNRREDVFLRDRTAGTTERVSETDHRVEGNSDSFGAGLSADGLTVAFGSAASNFVPDDTGDWSDVFVKIPCLVVASWSNYGAGFPGTFGIPSFTARANPVLGSTLVCDLANSSGLYTVAFVFLGLERADLPSAWGGDLLVAPFATKLIGLPPSGNIVGGDLPGYASLCGLVVDLQALELDPGAARGVSFTPGLELTLGR